MKISLDTNILIDQPQIVFDKEKEFVISFTVLRELDKLKRNPDLKRAAQAAIKNIWFQFIDNKIEILNIPKFEDIKNPSPDEKIIFDTFNSGAKLLSDDIGARVIAKAFGVPISNFEADSDIDYDYTGIALVEGDVDYEKNFVQIKEMQLEEFNTQFGVELKENQYCIIDRTTDKNDIWVHKRGTVTRISQSIKPYKDAGIVITPMDSPQMCALDAIFDPEVPLTVIDGELGTGKTLLTLMGALACTVGQKRYRHYDKILVTKPPVSINRDMYTGFKPGSSAEKMSGHLGGIKSNLSFLLDSRKDPSKAATLEDELKQTASDAVWEEFFDIVEIDEIQGTSLHHSILLVDEFQLLDTDTLKLVLSRISEGSKVVLIGDAQGQTYGMNRANEGFKVLYQHFGTAPEFSFIRLNKIYRSALAEFVANIFTKRG